LAFACVDWVAALPDCVADLSPATASAVDAFDGGFGAVDATGAVGETDGAASAVDAFDGGFGVADATGAVGETDGGGADAGDGADTAPTVPDSVP
jgi:hypothetical protein